MSSQETLVLGESPKAMKKLPASSPKTKPASSHSSPKVIKKPSSNLMAKSAGLKKKPASSHSSPKVIKKPSSNLVAKSAGLKKKPASSHSSPKVIKKPSSNLVAKSGGSKGSMKVVKKKPSTSWKSPTSKKTSTATPFHTPMKKKTAAPPSPVFLNVDPETPFEEMRQLEGLLRMQFRDERDHDGSYGVSSPPFERWLQDYRGNPDVDRLMELRSQNARDLYL